MARPLRLQVADGIYHVMARSNGGDVLFPDDVDRRCFLGCYADVIRDRGWYSLAYCVMGTHYHLLVETPEPDLADGMRDLNSGFARAWRDRRASHGHVFGGRYRAKLVQHDEYLVQAARYIVRNPVAADLCSAPGAWRWSSFTATCEESASPVLHPERLLRFFDSPTRSSVEVYREFVEDESIPEYDVRDTGLLGDDVFAKQHIPAQLPSPAVPSRFLTPRRPPLATLLASGQREHAAVLAHVEHGYLLKEIAEALDVHPSTVGRWTARRARDWT
jgi:putative transposase